MATNTVVKRIQCSLTACAVEISSRKTNRENLPVSLSDPKKFCHSSGRAQIGKIPRFRGFPRFRAFSQASLPPSKRDWPTYACRCGRLLVAQVGVSRLSTTKTATVTATLKDGARVVHGREARGAQPASHDGPSAAGVSPRGERPQHVGAGSCNHCSHLPCLYLSLQLSYLIDQSTRSYATQTHTPQTFFSCAIHCVQLYVCVFA